MIRLLINGLRRFLWDEKSAEASLRSILTLCASTAMVVIASASDATGGVNVEIIKQWDLQAWAIRIGAAFLGAAALRLKAGEKNDPAPPSATP